MRKYFEGGSGVRNGETHGSNDPRKKGTGGAGRPTAATARRGGKAFPRHGAAAGSGDIKSGGNRGRKDRGRTASEDDELIGFRFGLDLDSIRSKASKVIADPTSAGNGNNNKLLIYSCVSLNLRPASNVVASSRI